MKTMLPILLTFSVVLFSATKGWNADFEKGMYAYRIGDYATALSEFRLLAEQGNASAQIQLGGLYHYGDGVPLNYVEAYKWYNLATANGESRGSFGLDFIADKMTPLQIEEALRLAKECIESDYKKCGQKKAWWNFW